MSLIGFLTTFPARGMGLEDAAKRSYLFPLIGLIIGLVVGLASNLFFHLTDPMLAGILTLMILYFITGINHIDGLSDFSDGIYVMGDKEKKFQVMKDKQLGVAGFTVLFFHMTLLLYCYLRLGGIVPAIIVSEVAAKSGMLTSIFFGRPRGTGMGDVFVKNMKRNLFHLSIVFSIAVCFYFYGSRGVIALLGAIAASLVIVKISHKDLDCVSGDVFGATNELSRLVALLVLVTI